MCVCVSTATQPRATLRQESGSAQNYCVYVLYVLYIHAEWKRKLVICLRALNHPRLSVNIELRI